MGREEKDVNANDKTIRVGTGEAEEEIDGIFEVLAIAMPMLSKSIIVEMTP